MVYMKFSKERFLQNAEPFIKRKIKDHLNILDGMRVSFAGDFKYGYIKQYIVNDEKYELYPVEREWCQDEEPIEAFVQMNIADFIK